LKRSVKILCNRFIYIYVFVLLLSFVMNTGTAYAETDSYTYSLWNEAEKAPVAYQSEKSLHASDFGLESFQRIRDIFVKNDYLYAAIDNYILIADSNFKVVHTISSYDNNGTQDTLSAPNGIYVTEEGDIYVADPAKGSVFKFNSKFEFIQSFSEPENLTGMEGIPYQPLKVVVDHIGRIYVLAKNAYEGIIELKPDGAFSRYVGANQVSVSIVDLFWRTIATEKQLAQMKLWLPTDYSDIALDMDGFIYATVRGTDVSNPIRKLNAKGKDIMREYDRIVRPSGDMAQSGGKSSFTGIACSDDGRFAALDSTRSRIFVYNEDARLLYVLGGSGSTSGQFTNPIDVVFLGNNIIVADSITESIEVFVPTEYGSYINEANYYQQNYEYEKAAAAWEKVALINPNYAYAYVGIGKQELRNKDYEAAKNSFYTAQDVEYYSSSFAKVREAFLDRNFGTIISRIFALIVLLAVIKILRFFLKKYGLNFQNGFTEKLIYLKKQFFNYPLYLLSHPFKGYDEIKYEKKGSYPVCITILITLCLLNIIQSKYTSFMINYQDTNNINSILLILATIFPYLLFATANWSITTLMDGKGTFGEIFQVNMYALYPAIYLNLAAILLSNLVTLEEIPMVSMLFGLASFLYCFYLFIGLVVIHGYTFTKGVGSLLLTFVAMAVIVFILLLLVTLVGGFFDDIYTIVQEFTLLF